MTGVLRYCFKPMAIAGTLFLNPSMVLGDDYKIDDNGIATCTGNGNPKASRGELATPLANQFWSRMACGRWDEAFELLEDVPKAPIDMLPNPYAPSVDLKTDCYFNSFAYGPQYHKVDVTTTYGEDNQMLSQEKTVGHGFYELDLKKFQKIQGAMLWQCQPLIG